MKKLTLPLFVLAILLTSNISFSQSWLPKPVSSPYSESITGTWVSAPYEFMGNTTTEEITYNSILNGQFLEVNIVRSDNS